MNLQNQNTTIVKTMTKKKNKFDNKTNLKNKNAIKFESAKQKCDEAPKN
jgi:hypothetical protein